MFQCSSASRKFLKGTSAAHTARAGWFQCSSASRKFLKPARGLQALYSANVSVLFSEPKIPQMRVRRAPRRERDVFQCSSASRKFLKPAPAQRSGVRKRFQCSSASRKFLKRRRRQPRALDNQRFSALQRAENSSKNEPTEPPRLARAFQCSSASRKFLKPDRRGAERRTGEFQCSSASRKFLNQPVPIQTTNSSPFQCSSASRKFLKPSRLTNPIPARSVSVLFSEPKIPQCRVRRCVVRGRNVFQCSSASRKFLNVAASAQRRPRQTFQCSSASRKFLNMLFGVAVAFSVDRFSALQRAENSSIAPTLC